MAAVKAAVLSPIEEEQVIKARVLNHQILGKAEGPFKKLAKRFVALSDAGGSDAEIEQAYEALIKEIMLLEFQNDKYNAILFANQQEQQSYVAKQQELLDQIKQAEHDISQRKVELEEAKIIRQHNEEYEMLRQVLVEHPSRTTTQNDINKVKMTIDKIKTEEQRAVVTMQHRRKQFALLFHVIEDLQRSLDEPLDNGQEPGTAAGSGTGTGDAQQMDVDS